MLRFASTIMHGQHSTFLHLSLQCTPQNTFRQNSSCFKQGERRCLRRMYQDLCIVPLATTTNGIVYQPTIFVRIDPNSRAQRINCDGMTRLFIMCSHPVHIFFLTRRSHLCVIALRCILACHGTILRFFAIMTLSRNVVGHCRGTKL